MIYYNKFENDNLFIKSLITYKKYIIKLFKYKIVYLIGFKDILIFNVKYE